MNAYPDNREIEVLAPAGDETSAYAALSAGADAVYLGLTRFSARQSAENFDAEALARVTRFAHLLGAKVYVCLNTLVKEEETEAFFASARQSYGAGADAILVQDIFLGKVLKETYPEITLHLSTQAGCANVHTALLAKEFGFSRAVLARETPLEEIRKISEIIETEAFVQGALCTAFSGQCYFSSFAGGNSGNRGRCKQPCRKKYTIDRAGFENYAYALSPADLSVGRRVGEYLSAGVKSLKIEGRLRRSEYAAAAVRYYRALVNGKDGAEELIPLKRAFNRGDYTEGLSFGQKKFLSRKVQGHIGEEVGKVVVQGGKYFCKSSFTPSKGDGFKILRGGYEAGGGSFLSQGKGGFYLSSSDKLRDGDLVRVTTDTKSAEAVLSDRKKRRVRVRLTFLAGKRVRAEGEGICVEGEIAERALRAPLSEEALKDCFAKVDGLPLAPETAVETDGVFLPKSALNALRRNFYQKLAEALDPAREELPERIPREPETEGEAEPLTAVIGVRAADVGIFKPQDYDKAKPDAERYLYLPPFLTGGEEEKIRPLIEGCAGIYCDGYYALKLCEKYRKPLFAGTGFNLTNRYAAAEVQKRAKYFCLSKELSASEQRKLSCKGAFALAAGSIKLMDLIYCPFEKDCARCDQRTFYRMTDEERRAFPLRRYKIGGACRFEVYNCLPLSVDSPCGMLVDLSAEGDDTTLQYAAGGATKGRSERSMN